MAETRFFRPFISVKTFAENMHSSVQIPFHPRAEPTPRTQAVVQSHRLMHFFTLGRTLFFAYCYLKNCKLQIVYDSLRSRSLGIFFFFRIMTVNGRND